MRFIKLSFLTLFVTTLVSCGAYQYTTATKESNEATTEQQQAVKTQVMKLLEEEYQQPFKLKDFSYKYERHWVDSTCQMSFCEMEKYGTYNFKVKAIDNPIITMNFKFDDEKKESIKDVIDSFKKNQLHDRYCRGFASYYLDVMNDRKKIIQPYTEKTEKYCNKKDQIWYQEYKDYYLKHKDEYK
jgi:hypothetical protein